jgi:hypothetical protein
MTGRLGACAVRKRPIAHVSPPQIVTSLYPYRLQRRPTRGERRHEIASAPEPTHAKMQQKKVNLSVEMAEGYAIYHKIKKNIFLAQHASLKRNSKKFEQNCCQLLNEKPAACCSKKYCTQKNPSLQQCYAKKSFVKNLGLQITNISCLDPLY